MTYAFTFDASACSGCKACQVACKDKNSLPVGVLWRRVYEVSGGDWKKIGTTNPGAWENTVFAYNLTIACNHCVHPKCAGVCPTDAYVVREDGIVYIDTDKCMGCGYCSWACPYAAPQYNPSLGHMTKCDFCYDNLDTGLPPTCVAACPMRVLDFGNTDEISQESGEVALWEAPSQEHPFPMPEYSHTEPHLAVQPHAGMTRIGEGLVGNVEEVKPKKTKSEFSLVIFTLLTQMAAGMAVLSFLSGSLTMPKLLTLGGLISIAGLISLVHLGRPLNARRSLNHLKKSWLSREILFFGLFGTSWLLALVMPGMGKLPLAIFGIGLVYSMAQVYRLRSVPAWDSNRTLLIFVVSAVVLGGLFLEFFDASLFRRLLVVLGQGTALWLSVSDRGQAHQAARRLRLGLIVLALAGVAVMVLFPGANRVWLIIPIFLIVLVEEIIGRRLFYEHLHQRII
jgi:anaerobic dimethyl sulfoxide reductase subunit B (iron-sulfur subunit)